MAIQGSAVAVCREGGRWHCDLLPLAVLTDLEHLIAAVRQQTSESGPLALVNTEDEFFIAIRVMPDGRVRLLLSDATAALDWDLARQAVEYLDEELPDEEDAEEIWPAGDLDLFADLGLPGEKLRMIVDDIDLYADEMLAMIAGRLGFADEYAQALDSLPSR